MGVACIMRNKNAVVVSQSTCVFICSALLVWKTKYTCIHPFAFHPPLISSSHSFRQPSWFLSFWLSTTSRWAQPVRFIRTGHVHLPVHTSQYYHTHNTGAAGCRYIWMKKWYISCDRILNYADVFVVCCLLVYLAPLQWSYGMLMTK